MKIALYKSIETGTEYENEVSDFIEESDNYVRTTEIVDIEFVRLPDINIVPLQVAGLERAKKAADIAHQVVIKTIDEKISKLLAITDQSQ